MKLFYTLFAVFVLSHVYIFVCLRRAFGSGLWQLTAIVWLTAMALSWFFRFGRPMGPVGEKFQDVTFFWMGFLILFCYCLVSFDLLALLSRILSCLPAAPLQKLPSFFVASRYVPIAIAIASALFIYSLYEAATPRLRHVTLTTNKLPASSPPLRVVGIADVHISSIIGPWMLERMAGRITETAPDILVVSGDLVDTDVSKRDKDAGILRSIPAKLGKFAVTGNHEYYHGLLISLDFMEKSGFRPLRGEAVEAGGIIIAGVDDGNFAKRFTPDTTNVLRVLETVPEDKFVLLLNHKPYYPTDTVGHFDLQFSGHTHGGQFWPGRIITRHIYRLRQGMNVLREGKETSLLYITNGIGFWGPPIRFFTPPEITIITLKPEAARAD